MKVKIGKADILPALTTAANIAERRSTVAILSHVLLSAERGLLTIAATDLCTAAHATVACTVEKNGAIAIEARRLLDIVKGLPGDTLTIEKGADAQVEIKSGRSTFRLHAIAATDFPKMATAPKEMLPFNAAVFCEIAGAAFHAVGLDASRPTIENALFTRAAGSMRMVATDGHRLFSAIRASESTVAGADIRIPRKGLEDLRKALDGATDAVAGVADGQFFVRFGSMTIATKVSDVPFPPFETLIPKAFERQIKISRDALLDCAQRVAKMIPSGAVDPRSMLAIDNDALSISAEHTETGSAEDSVECEYSGTRFEAGIGPRYLIDALSSLTGEEVTVKTREDFPCFITACISPVPGAPKFACYQCDGNGTVKGAHQPVILADADGSFAVVMPMRL